MNLLNMKRAIFALTLLILVIIGSLYGKASIANASPAQNSFDCLAAAPNDVPIAGVWSYPQGLSKSDIPYHQGLVTNSAVNPRVPHNGEDYGNHPAGYEIRAAADGIVACIFEGTDVGNLGHAVFVLSKLRDGSHITTLYGHLSADRFLNRGDQVIRGETIIGKIGNKAENGGWDPHLHVGIRDGYVIRQEDGWPLTCWGYLKPTCPFNVDEEFKHWHALSDFVAKYPSSGNPPASASLANQTWRTQSEKSTGILAGWWTFGTCDTRRMKIYLDGNEIFHTFSEDGANAAHSTTIWMWPGDHEYKIDLFDPPNTSDVELSWAFAPLQPNPPVCASDVASTPSNPTPISKNNSVVPNPDRPVKALLDAISRMDMDAAVNESFAPENRLIAGAGLEIARSIIEQRGLTLKFSSVEFSTTSNNGTKAVVHAAGYVMFLDKAGNSEEDIFDIDFPVSRSGNDWYVDPDIQKIQQLLQTKNP